MGLFFVLWLPKSKIILILRKESNLLELAEIKHYLGKMRVQDCGWVSNTWCSVLCVDFPVFTELPHLEVGQGVVGGDGLLGKDTAGLTSV